MSIEINGISQNSQGPIRGKKSSAPDNPERVSNPVPDNKAESKPSSTSVNISNTAQLLSKLEAELKDSSDTNTSKVEELRTAIKEGTYNIDSSNVAQKMLDLE